MNETFVEYVVFGQLAAAGYATGRGDAFSPDHGAAERTSWESAVLTRRLRERLAALNPALAEAEIDGVLRPLMRPPHTTLVENNRRLHGLLVDDVPADMHDAAAGGTRRAGSVDRLRRTREQRLARRATIRAPEGPSSLVRLTSAAVVLRAPSRSLMCAGGGLMCARPVLTKRSRRQAGRSARRVLVGRHPVAAPMSHYKMLAGRNLDCFWPADGGKLARSRTLTQAELEHWSAEASRERERPVSGNVRGSAFGVQGMVLEARL